MSNYRRNYIKGGTWFFTVNLRDRQSSLLTDQIVYLKNAIAQAKRQKPFHINAWVILPEHMHCIWTLPVDDCDFSGRWREIKKKFSRDLGRDEIWQPRFWEHTIRNEEDYRRHVDYCYINPVKHGWVKRVQDWAGEVREFLAGERV